MAKIGLKDFYYAPIATDTSTGTTYEAYAVLAGAISSSFAPSIAEASLYYDDAKGEYVSQLQGGVLTLGIDDADDTIFAGILGQTVTAAATPNPAIITSTTSDAPVPVGFGHIIPKIKGGTHYWKAQVFAKVLFKPYTDAAATKGDSITFTTPSVEGEVLPTTAGVIEKHATFTTEAAALTWLQSQFPTV